MIVYSLNNSGGAAGGGAAAFLDLSDTPGAYGSQALKALRVNSGETAVEFFDGVAAADASQWFALTFSKPTDADNDPLHFRVEIDTDADFSSPIIDWDSRAAEDGVSGCFVFDGTEWVAYPSGGAGAAYDNETVAFTFQSASISRGTRYYYRIRFHDGTAWGDYTGGMIVW